MHIRTQRRWPQTPASPGRCQIDVVTSQGLLWLGAQAQRRTLTGFPSPTIVFGWPQIQSAHKLKVTAPYRNPGRRRVSSSTERVVGLRDCLPAHRDRPASIRRLGRRHQRCALARPHRSGRDLGGVRLRLVPNESGQLGPRVRSSASEKGPEGSLGCGEGSLDVARRGGGGLGRRPVEPTRPARRGEVRRSVQVVAVGVSLSLIHISEPTRPY